MTTLRADAQRNRRLLLEAASELFAQRGLAVTLDDVAHHAGVGVGTAYRRFANKEELIDELFNERVAEIAALADEALTRDDAGPAFFWFIERYVGFQAENRGFRQVMTSLSPSRERISHARQEIAPRVTRLVDRAREAGAVRADMRPSDVPMLAIMIGALSDAVREEDPDLWRRYLALYLDGLRAGGAAPLPHEALRPEQVAAVMGRLKGLGER